MVGAGREIRLRLSSRIGTVDDQVFDACER